MRFIRENVLAGKFMAGAWCNLASSIGVEIAAGAGFDWLCIDQEHGPGDSMTLLGQLQAVGQLPCAPIVRIAWNELTFFKRALDLGASGIMVPFVETAEDAKRAVSYLRYPPEGQRGASLAARAAGFGTNFEEYFSKANQNLLSIHQIETVQAIGNLDDIARVDGVDVLFVGPLDLSLSAGLPKRFEDQEFRALLSKVAAGAKAAGKAAGILLPSAQYVGMVREMGYTVVAVGNETSILSAAMRSNREAMR